MVTLQSKVVKVRKWTFLILLSSIFSLQVSSEKIPVTTIESNLYEQTLEEKIQKELEALELISRTEAEKSAQKRIEEENRPKKVSEDDFYEPLESVGENFGRIKKLVEKIENEKSDYPLMEKSLVVEKTEIGVRLSIRNLQFQSDSDKLLKGESEKIEKIAEVLKQIPDSKFLIEGHSAHIGDDSGEMTLSLKRAKKIASELSKKGIPLKNFICKGLGGTNPIAPNTTKEGRSTNRRVEITIIE